MRILVCGDRNWTNYDMIRGVLQTFIPDTVIEGEAKGADKLGREAAEELGIPVLKFPAHWERYGAAAGPIRNQQMLVEGKPDLVIAFHDDLPNSKGTKNMVNRARKAGLKVMVYTQQGCKTIYEPAGILNL